eukprot:15454857-Heterocapsa_arctica.AAC.1
MTLQLGQPLRQICCLTCLRSRSLSAFLSMQGPTLGSARGSASGVGSSSSPPPSPPPAGSSPSPPSPPPPPPP